MNYATPSASVNLQKKTDRHIMVIATTLILGLVLWLIFYTLSKQQLAEIELTRQEIESTHVSDQQLITLGQLVDNNAEVIQKMFEYFPNEENIIDTFEIIEMISKKYDPQAIVNIPSETPTKKGDQLQIPLEIKLNTTIESLTKLLREFEQLPLFIEINSMNITHTDTNVSQISLGVSLYVDEPFVQPEVNPTN